VSSRGGLFVGRRDPGDSRTRATVDLNTDNGYASEIAWSGSGGGISTYELKPSYQSTVTQSRSKRSVPDVAPLCRLPDILFQTLLQLPERAVSRAADARV
jgi:hypothetical protein